MTFTINRNSWHYWLSTKLGDFRPHYDDSQNNLCAYMQQVFKGAALLLFGTAITSVLAFIFCSTIAVLVHLFMPFSIHEQVAAAGKAGLVLFGFSLIPLGTYLWIYRESDSVAEPKPPGFIKTAYRSIKDKTCIRIELK